LLMDLRTWVPSPQVAVQGWSTHADQARAAPAWQGSVISAGPSHEGPQLRQCQGEKKKVRIN
jgi:hypothetical protein